jgi:hypothetical protein
MRSALFVFFCNQISEMKNKVCWPACLITILLIVVSGFAPAARATVTVNHLNLPTSQSSAATNTFTTTASTGNFIAVAIAASTADVFTGVTDNKGNTYVAACPASGPCKGTTTPGGQTLMYYAKGATTGVTSVTIALSTFSGVIDVAVYDLAGVDTTAPLDVAAELSAQASTANPSGPGVTATTAGGIVISVMSTTSTATAAAAPFTFGAMKGGDGTAYDLNSTAGTFTPSWTTSPAGTWSGFTAAFKAASTGGGGHVTLNHLNLPTSQSSAATNTFATTASTGNFIAVAIAASTADVFTGVSDNKGNTYVAACPASGPCKGTTTPGGQTLMYYAKAAATGVTSVTIALSTFSGVIDVAVYDLSGVDTTSPLDVAAELSAQASTANPSGPGVTATTAGGIVISVMSTTSTATAAAAPFTFGAMKGGDGTAYDLNTSAGTFTPSWTTSPAGTWSGFTAAFKAASTGAISVSVAPAAATVPTGAAQPFTATVTNDSANAGVTWALSGTGCSGATCGTLSATSSGSGVAITYTAPASVPNPATVTLKATSVTDGTKSSSATITLTTAAVISVSVSPTSATVNAGGSQTMFTATVTNDSANRGVNWSLSGSCSGTACGTLSATSTGSGVPVGYTPPASISSTLVVTLTAKSVTDSTKSASATITVNPAVAFSCAHTSCPAFPGAEGGGAASVGGRGGVVYEITCTSDAVNGCGGPTQTVSGFTNASLRDCIQANVPRNCVFRLSGIFTQKSRLAVVSPFLTIAGQTAPGGGVVLGGVGQSGEGLDVQTHDVVARYLTYDGLSTSPTGPDTGTVGFEEANGTSSSVFNVVFDHLSGRWQGNKFLLFNNSESDTITVEDSTWQWSLFYEPNICHPVGPLLSSEQNPIAALNTDFHHNLFMNMGHRIPLADFYQWRWVSNITYNWDYFASAFPSSMPDFIDNAWVGGNLNVGNSNPHPINTWPGSGSLLGCVANCNLPATPSIYMSGNTCNTGNPALTMGVDFDCTAEEGTSNGDVEGFPETAFPVRTAWRRSTPLPTEPFPIIADPANNLSTLIPPVVGNSQHLDPAGSGAFLANRDSQDTRVISQFNVLGPGGEFGNPAAPPPNETCSTTPQYFYSPSYKGPQTAPAVAVGTPCTSTLHDGICDAWKSKYGLSLTDTGLYSRTDPNTGLTYLEDYMDGVAP